MIESGLQRTGKKSASIYKISRLPPFKLRHKISAVISTKFAAAAPSSRKRRIVPSSSSASSAKTPIDALAGDTVKDLRDESGELRWESYLIKLLKGGRVVLAGQGRRGAIFAVYELSRLFGVSPWYFFADVPVKKSEALFLPKDFLKIDWSSVQYRGIFLNDEEELNAWAKLYTKDGTIGPTIPLWKTARAFRNIGGRASNKILPMK